MNVHFNPMSSVLLDANQQDCTGVKESLDKAEELFKDFTTADQATKETMIGHLSTSYSKLQSLRVGKETIPSGFESTAARIFYLYGKCLYNGDMQASRRLFELSLTVTFVELKEIKADAIPDLPTDLQSIPSRFSDDGHDFQPLEDFIALNSTDTLAEIIYLQGNEKAFDIAMTFRWLGATYQNITDFHKLDYLPLFQKIYGTVCKTWERIGTQDSLWEVGQIIYNTHRFLHHLEHPNDTAGAINTLKALVPYLKAEGDSLRAKHLRAQIHNIMAVEISKLPATTLKAKQDLLRFQFEQVSKAVNIITSDPRFDRFLQAMMIHNQASRALACLKEGIPVVEVSTLKGWIDRTIAFMETEKYNHYYFSTFLRTAANFESYQHNWKAALQLLDKSEEVAKMYPSSCTADLPIIAKAKQEVFEAMRL